MNRKFKFKIDQYNLVREPEEGEELYFGEGLNYKTGDSQTLDLHHKDGARHMVVYGQIHYARFEHNDNAQIIKLFHSTHMVIITGYRMDILYEKIKQQKLVYLKESQETQLAIADEDEPFISKIEIDWHSTVKYE